MAISNGFDITGISVWTKEDPELIKAAVAKGKTMDRCFVLPGVKYHEKIGVLDNSIVVQDNSNGGWSATGSVAINQIDVYTTPLCILDELYYQPLQSYFVAQNFDAGSAYSEQLGPILAESYSDKLSKENEEYLWSNMNKKPLNGATFSGFIKTLKAETTRVKSVGTYGYTASYTTSNIIAAVDAMCDKLPDAVMTEPQELSLSPKLFRMLTSAYRTAYGNNIMFGKAGENGDFEIYLPGYSNIKAVATTGLGQSGLDSDQYMVLTNHKKNMGIATDLLNEQERMDIWYSKEIRGVKVDIEWKLGTFIKFPTEVVCNF